ncbi:hypothetical protein BN14_10643 [Rhizoctonia solani AG-1 IB]|nr:hypothetical protein BN14_10643 [Rhizoctonia solani AG-1 IB]
MPLLRSHVHPYAVIINAGKKLATAGMARTSHIPADLLLNVIMIYTTLTEAHQTARSNSLSVQNDYSRRRSPSDTDTAASDAATGTSRDSPRRSPVIRNEDSSTQTTGANDSPLRDFDDLFDNFDDELHEMADDFGYLSRDTLSVSTPNGLGASISKTFIVDRCWSFQNSKRQNCVEWMIEVELARQQSELINPPDEESLHTRMYRSEPPRPPPTKNWHSWTSEFAPWWVVLPEPKDRGVVSSNDWAEIKNFPPLMRKVAP